MFEVIIDHLMVGNLPPLGHFDATLLEPTLHVVLRVASASKSLLLHLLGRGKEEHDPGVGTSGQYLSSSFDLDLKQNITAGRRDRDWGSIEVPQEFCPLDEAVALGMCLERGAIDEEIRILVLAISTLPSGPAPTQPEIAITVEQASGNRPLPGPPWADQDQDARLSER